MGYPADIIYQLHKFGVAPGSSLGDCGSQDFAESQISHVNRFSSELFGLDERLPMAVTTARDVFNRLGFSYTCFDVDHRDGTEYLDFHSLRFPRERYNSFDMTLDGGTIEHLNSPIGLLFFMHQATKVGGLMWHIAPAFGWGNHGLNNLTPKYWLMLAAYNNYEIVDAEIIPTTFHNMPPGNEYGDHLSFVRGLETFRQSSAMMRIIFRKRVDNCFLPPFDIDNPTPSPKTERLLRDSLGPLRAAGSVTAEEIEKAIAWHFGRPAP